MLIFHEDVKNHNEIMKNTFFRLFKRSSIIIRTTHKLVGK